LCRLEAIPNANRPFRQALAATYRFWVISSPRQGSTSATFFGEEIRLIDYQSKRKSLTYCQMESMPCVWTALQGDYYMSGSVLRCQPVFGASVDSAQNVPGRLTSGRLTKTLRASVSVGVLAVLLPSMAFGQAVPAECTPDPATIGDTVTCVAAAPTVIAGISTTVDDLTVVIGGATTPTTVENAAGDGVGMSGDGSLSLTITNVASSVSGSDNGVSMDVGGGAGNLSITSEGEIYGDESGIYAINSSTGALSLDVAGVTGGSEYGIFAANSPFSTDLTITASGTVSGGYGGVSAHNYGSGALTISVADVDGGAGAGVYAVNGSGFLLGAPLDGSGPVFLPLTLSTDLSITSTGTVSGALFGIYAINNGSGALTIDTVDATGTDYVGILAVNLGDGTDLSITSSGMISGGEDGIYALNYGTGALTISTNNVTGIADDGIFAVNVSGTDLSINSTGLVSGADEGVQALNYGSGSLMISVANVTATDGSGIDATNGFGAVPAEPLSANRSANPDEVHAPAPVPSDLTIIATGTVTGGDDGIYALNYGSGALTIDANNVTGAGHDGIFAVNVYGTDLSITATGLVSGQEDGVHGLNYGSGALTINVNDVTATDDNGIDANNGYTSVAIASLATGTQSNSGLIFAPRPIPTNLTIIATGTVSGGQTGIDARSFGSGAVTINAVDVTGIGGFGIYATNSTAGTDLSVTSTGHVSGYLTGISAINQGTGALSVIADSVDSSTSTAISAIGGANGTSVSVTTSGLISSAGTGIRAVNSGSGSTSIDAGGDVSAGFIGIYASNTAAGGDLSISSSGHVASESDGIHASHNGSGRLSVDAASVTSVTGTGIFARTSSTSTGVSITASGLVSGPHIGVYADNQGSGSTVLDLAAVTSAASDAVRVRSASTTTDVSVTATGSITGADDGVDVRSLGSGSLTVDVADVTGNGTYSYGITANLASSGTDLSVTASGAVTGGQGGVRVNNQGSGATTVTVVDVSGGTQDGVRARTGYSGIGTDLAITSTGTVTGQDSGIDARNNGTGSLTVAALNATGVTEDGIVAIQSAYGTDLSVTANGLVSGATGGIRTRNFGTGSTTIHAADVTSSAGFGIYASRDSNGTSLSITSTGSISSYSHGVFTLGNGTGALSIAAADITSSAGWGIFAQNVGGADTGITSTGTVSGYSGGIRATHFASGALNIDVATVTGTAGHGLYAYANDDSSGIEITATGSINGATQGINSRSFGTGDMTISVVDVSGGSDTGLYARTGSSGTNLSITATGSVAGGSTGILASHSGSGALTINAVDVSGAGGTGIYTSAGTGSSGMSITSTGTVTGTLDGINASNLNLGLLNVTAVDVTGHSGNGIAVSGVGGSVTVSTSGTVTGHNTGIWARSVAASGSLRNDNLSAEALPTEMVITTTGSVLGGLVGIYAINGATSGDLSITSSGLVSAGETGIVAWNYGTGALTLNATDVLGGSRGGIYGVNTANGTDLSITATGSLSGGTNGIYAFNYGSGDLSVNAHDVTGLAGVAIKVEDFTGGDVDVATTGTVDGGFAGITAVSDYGGSVSVATLGTVSGGVLGIGARATGGDVTLTTTGSVYGGSVGIIATSTAGSQRLTIDGGVIGGSYGILAAAYGGTQILTINSDISGGIIGISAVADLGAQVTVSAGASVTGGSAGIYTGSYGPASNDAVTIAGTVNGLIRTFAGNDTVTASDGGTINGVVFLDDGDDTFNLDGGTFTAARGGDGSDTVNFNASGGWIINSGAATDVLAEFEIFNFLSGGYVLDGLHQGLTETNFLGGNNILLGDLVSADVLIGVGAGLEVANGASITGNLENAGRLGINGNFVGEFTVDGNFTQAATGQLSMDVDPRSGVGDSLIVTGDVTLGGGLAISQFGLFGETVTLIDGGTGLSGAFDSVTGLLEGRLLVSQAVEYDLANFNVNLVTTYTDASTIGGLTPNQISLAGGLTGQLGTGAGNADFRGFGFTVASIDEIGVLGGALDQLSPELFDAGLQVVRNSQMLFMSQMMGQRPGANATPQPVQVASLSSEIPSGIVSDDRAQVWSSVRFAGAEQTGGGNYVDYETVGFEVAAGVADLQAGNFLFGLAVGYADYETDLDGPDLDRVTTDVFRLGLHGTYEMNSGGSGLNSHLDASIAVASGTNNVQMDIASPPIGMARHQAADIDFDMFNTALRLTLDGSDGHEWAIKPYLLVTTDGYNQSSVRIGSGAATALNIERFSADRVSYGVGAMMQHEWSEASRLMLRATSLHHTGDTSAALSTHFAAPGLGTTNAFTINGRDIEDQYLFEGELIHEYASGLSISVQSYAQYGDLEGMGAQFRLSRKF
jgi:hypothetical protein